MAESIFDSVGKGGRNHLFDVKKVQALLNTSSVIKRKLNVDGRCGPRTFNAILQYQMSIFNSPNACDGRIDPNGNTLRSLNNPQLVVPKKRVSAAEIDNLRRKLESNAATPAMKGKLSEADFQMAAKSLGGKVEVAMIRAMAEVESGGRSGFGSTGFPKIAYEGHYFQRYTKHVYDNTYPLLSYTYSRKAGQKWQTNNKNDATAVATLQKAIKLDRKAALMSCSWGMFQIMGDHYKKCGFGSVEAFAESMKKSEKAQLQAFVDFCKNTRGIVAGLEKKDFRTCAILYNGRDYGDYDKKIKKAYQKYVGV